MYANFMAHADMFVSITSGTTAEERIICFVEYYLTAFHEGRKGAVAKKPYNPIIGETFHCSWNVPKNKVKASGVNSTLTIAKDQSKIHQAFETCKDSTEIYNVRFTAEQVSHHPPVSGFYCECKERKMCVNAHVWTKSKFMGMSIGVTMAGEGKKSFEMNQFRSNSNVSWWIANSYNNELLLATYNQISGCNFHSVPIQIRYLCQIVISTEAGPSAHLANADD